MATAVDQVVPASQDIWTPIVELLQLTETNASVIRTSRPEIVSTWPVPGVGIAEPPDEQAEGRELLALAVRVLGGVDVVVGVDRGLHRAADGVHWPPVGTAVATLPVHELSQVAEPHGV